MNEEDRYSADPFVNPPPHPKTRKEKFSLLCKLFDHKYIDVELAPGVIEPECKRCGKLRDVHPPKKKPNLVGKIKVNKKYRIENEGEPVRNADDWAKTKIVYDGAIYPKQHAGHIVKAIKYYPPTGASSTGSVEIECITCEKILDFLVSDQFLEELK